MAARSDDDPITKLVNLPGMNQIFCDTCKKPLQAWGRDSTAEERAAHPHLYEPPEGGWRCQPCGGRISLLDMDDSIRKAGSS